MPSSAVSFLFARKRNPFFSFLFADYGNVQKPLWRRVQWQWGYKKSLQWFYLQLQSILHLLTFKVWPLHVGICIRLFGNQGNSMCRRVLILLQLLHFNHHFPAISLMWPPLESVQLHSRGARSISSYQTHQQSQIGCTQSLEAWTNTKESTRALRKFLTRSICGT